jgi:hypothetical protein
MEGVMTEGHVSRRYFLLSSILGVAGTAMWVPTPAWAKKTGVAAGPHPIATQEWPPAIVPDHMGVDRGYCCFTDEFGRLAVVDLRRPADAKHPPHVVAELNGLGKKVIDFKVVPGRGYGAVLKGTDGSDEQLTLICINLQPITDPVVIGQVPLDKFNEVTCLTANNNLVCVAGTSFGGENLLAIYQVQPHGRAAEPSLAATWTARNPIVDLDLQDRNLAILESGQLDYLSLVTPSVPEEKGTVNLDGDFKALARFRDVVLVTGTAGGDKDNPSVSGDSIAKCISLVPTPKVVSKMALDPITSVLDTCALKDRFIVLGDGASERYIASLPFDKLHQLSSKQVVALPKDKGNAYGQQASVLVSGKSAYIASGWAGVQVMSQAGDSWTPTYTYTIPRLPASGIATWADKVVIAGSDLKLYDISQPQKLALTTTASLPSTVRSIVGAGSYVVCLSKDQMTLRKMENLATPVATVPIVGQQVCYDKIDQRAYVLHDQTKTTSVTKFKLYSNDILCEKTFNVPGSFARGSANGGFLALCGLNDITLFGLSDKADPIGTRHFENLAIRDIVLLDQVIAAAAVDQKSKGFLLLLSKDQKDLRVLGSLDLPHDAIALAAAKNKVVVIGKTPDGKDLATILDISNTAAPKILSNVSAIEAASAVALKDQYGIIAGRGIEIISLS